MQLITHVLYDLTTVLLAPVVFILLASLVWSLFQTGALLREWVDRNKKKRNWQAFVENEMPASKSLEEARSKFFARSDYPTLIEAFSEKGQLFKDSMDRLDRLVSEIEIEANEQYARISLWTRIGPMLGLMGTLIPMGPALLGLSTRNMDVLARNLTVAFSTTVVGLIIGVLCLIISETRRRWYLRDILNIEHVIDATFGKPSEKNHE